MVMEIYLCSNLDRLKKYGKAPVMIFHLLNSRFDLGA
jgi:hypothetical protein